MITENNDIFSAIGPAPAVAIEWRQIFDGESEVSNDGRPERFRRANLKHQFNKSS